MTQFTKASDEEILQAYQATNSIWKAAASLNMAGQSVHERLVKLGIKLNYPPFSEEEKATLIKDYLLYRNLGQLNELAKLMNRTKQFICRQARQLGLTSQSGPKPYSRIWKGMTEEKARPIFDKFKRSSFTLNRFCKRYGFDDLGFSRSMSGLFPDEWDAVIESKTPRQTKYRLGRAFEYRVRDELRKKSYFVLRSPRSGSPVDLIAVKKSHDIVFIQCKRGGAIGVDEWNEFFHLCISVGAQPILAEMGFHEIVYWKMIAPKDGSRRAQPKIRCTLL